MKIKYRGDGYTEVFGLAFKPGETMDVADEYAAEKLRFNPLFEAADAKDRPKDGDKPKPVKPSDALLKTVEEARAAHAARINAEIIADFERKKREG